LLSKVGVKETRCEDGRWIELAQDRVQRLGFFISGVERRVSCSVRWVLGKRVVRMGGGWNWLRIVSNCWLLY
jgi:hypothetical protein